jgi:RimJ/RimL family protein N-acetyltransferase
VARASRRPWERMWSRRYEWGAISDNVGSLGCMQKLITDRLVVREWTLDDASAALAIYGVEKVTRWLTPAMGQVADEAAMRGVLHAWIEAQPNLLPPRGRWAVERRDTGEVVGGLGIRLLPPYEEDLELSWQLRPEAWGHGYAAEAGTALTRWAFTQEIDELFAVARPSNTRAIGTAKRLGMSWVGETDKYYNLRLQVFRIRPSDLTD